MNLSTTLTLLLSTTLLPSTQSASQNNYQLQKHINPDVDEILASLSQYSKLYISVPKHSSHAMGHGYGNCVWSECGLDDQTDDLQMGDNRDGDGRWYKFRTQFFCANAAYSLYGVKKGEVASGTCNKLHFINSFFTYGGADNLLKAVGVTPDIYYDNYITDDMNVVRRSLNEEDKDGENQDDENQDDAAAYDDAYEYVRPAYVHDRGNSNCVPLDDNFSYGDEGDDAAAEEGEEQDQEGEGDEPDRRRDRNLGSQSGDVEKGYSSSLGCDTKGNYIMAYFQHKSCNGNYFMSSIDSMSNYNDEFGNIGCHEIFTNKGSEDYTQEAVYALLRDSWACDTALYPHACPDPYGIKKIDEFALHTASRGGNGVLAYRNQKAQKPMHIISGLFVGLAACMYGAAYYLKNQNKLGKKGGGTIRDDVFGNKDSEVEMKGYDDGYKVPGGVVA